MKYFELMAEIEELYNKLDETVELEARKSIFRKIDILEKQADEYDLTDEEINEHFDALLSD